MSLATATLQYTLSTHCFDSSDQWLDLLLDNDYILSLFEQIESEDELLYYISKQFLSTAQKKMLFDNIIDARDQAISLIQDDEFIDSNTTLYTYCDSDTGYNIVTDYIVKTEYEKMNKIAELFL